MLTPEEIDRILNALQESEWDEAVVEIGDVRIAVARNGASVPRGEALARTSPSHSDNESSSNQTDLPAVTPISKLHAVDTVGDGTLVAAPSVGIFWRSPEPGAAPFVEVGAKVSEGDVLCIVEVMKLMMNVTASTNGIITGIHTQNGEAVEFGTPLFTISQS